MFPDGSKYAGGFSNDLREGIGVLESPHGWKYAGEWKQGRRHGNGELVTAVYRYEGEWRDDHRTGRGKERLVETYATFEGEFQLDQRVRGKLSIEAPGKVPFVCEIDHESVGNMGSLVTKYPPGVVGVQFMTMDF